MDMYGYTKDLTVIVPDLSNIFIIDNSPGAYRSNPGKCIYVHMHRMDVHTYVHSNLHVLQLWDQLTQGCTCIRKYVCTCITVRRSNLLSEKDDDVCSWSL